MNAFRVFNGLWYLWLIESIHKPNQTDECYSLCSDWNCPYLNDKCCFHKVHEQRVMRRNIEVPSFLLLIPCIIYPGNDYEKLDNEEFSIGETISHGAEILNNSVLKLLLRRLTHNRASLKNPPGRHEISIGECWTWIQFDPIWDEIIEDTKCRRCEIASIPFALQKRRIY